MTIITKEEAKDLLETLNKLEVAIALSEISHEIEKNGLRHVISEHEQEIEGLLERLEMKDEEIRLLWSKVNELEAKLENN